MLRGHWKGLMYFSAFFPISNFNAIGLFSNLLFMTILFTVYDNFILMLFSSCASTQKELKKQYVALDADV